MLEQGDDADFLPDEDGNILTAERDIKAPMHKNIRGREYYGHASNINEIKKSRQQWK